MTTRFYIVSAHLGLVGTADTRAEAERTAVVATVNTGRPVYLHDRLTEVSK